MIVAVANPILAVIGVLAVVALVFALVRKLVKWVFVLALVAIGAWVWFFAG